MLFQVVREAADGHPIDARATFVGLHSPQCFLQILSLTHLLHQSVGARWAFASIRRLGRFSLFLPARASPVGTDEKSSLNWMFSRLSPSRLMSYLPLLSFGPSATVPGSTYLLTPPFGTECLTSLADDMTYYALC